MGDSYSLIEWLILGLHLLVPLLSWIYLREIGRREIRFQTFPLFTGVLALLGALLFITTISVGGMLTFLVYFFLLPAPACALGIWVFRLLKRVRLS